MGPMTLKITRCHFWSKNRENQFFDVCCPEISSCASKPLLLRCKLVILYCMCQVSLGLKEVQMGAHDFENNKLPLFGRKTGKINIWMSAAPKIAVCQVSLGLKEAQMGAHDFENNKVSLFGQKKGKSILRCLLPRN